MMTNRCVVFRKLPEVTELQVAEEVNQIWGTASVDGSKESYLPKVTNWDTRFNGYDYCRTLMDDEHANALQSVLAGGYIPQTAEVMNILDGNEPVLLGVETRTDENGNVFQEPDEVDVDGNVISYKDKLFEVWLGEVR